MPALSSRVAAQRSPKGWRARIVRLLVEWNEDYDHVDIQQYADWGAIASFGLSQFRWALGFAGTRECVHVYLVVGVLVVSWGWGEELDDVFAGGTT